MAARPLALLAALLLALGLGGCDLVLRGRTDPPPPLPSLDGFTPARVQRVVDGDTIQVAVGGEEYTVRYIGVDAPETVRPNYPVEWMGPEASAANRELVAGKTVYLEKDVSETDSFGRLLRYVYLADGTMVNAELVRRGYAQSSAYPPDIKHQEALDHAERQAREAGRGLWGAEGTSTAAAGSAAPAPSPSPGPTSAGGRGVSIGAVRYRGEIKPNEPDEYVEIRNDGPTEVNLEGWRLNAGSDGQDFIFPAVRLRLGQVCRVYTDEVHTESCGLSFRSSGALWRNSGDCARLYDGAGALVDETCY